MLKVKSGCYRIACHCLHPDNFIRILIGGRSSTLDSLRPRSGISGWQRKYSLTLSFSSCSRLFDWLADSSHFLAFNSLHQ